MKRGRIPIEINTRAMHVVSVAIRSIVSGKRLLFEARCSMIVDPGGHNGDAPFGVSDRYVGDQDPGAGLWSCHFD